MVSNHMWSSKHRFIISLYNLIVVTLLLQSNIGWQWPQTTFAMDLPSSESDLIASAPQQSTLSSRYVIFLGGINSSSSLQKPIDDAFKRIQNDLSQNLQINRFIYFSYKAVNIPTRYCERWGTENCTSDNNLGDLFAIPNYTQSETHLSILSQANALDWLIQQIINKDKSAQIDLIGFSLGGTVASYWASRNDNTSSTGSHIHAIILINSPVGGIPLGGPIIDGCQIQEIECHIWRLTLGDLFGDLVLRDLQIPVDSESARESIVDDLQAVSNKFPVVSIESTNDYLVNGQTIQVCADVFCNSTEVYTITVGIGSQNWSPPPTSSFHQPLGGALLNAPFYNLQAKEKLIPNHHTTLSQPQTIQWVREGIQRNYKPSAIPTVLFEVDYTTLDVGQCAVLNWHVEHVQSVYLNGQEVITRDSRQICPSSTRNYTLTILHQDGTEEERSVTLQVNDIRSEQPCVGSGSKYTCIILATTGWQQTPLTVQPDTTYSILHISGGWTANAQKLPYVGPNGYPQEMGWQNPDRCRVARFIPHAKLLLRLGDITLTPYGPEDSNIIWGSDGNNRETGPLSIRINEIDDCLADNDGAIVVEIQLHSPIETTEGTVCGQFLRINQTEEKFPAFQPYGTNHVWIIDPSEFSYLENIFQEGQHVQITDPTFGDDFAPAWGYSWVRNLIDDNGAAIVSSCEAVDTNTACVGADGIFTCTVDAKTGWHLTPLVLGLRDRVYIRYVSGAWTANKEKLEYWRPGGINPSETYLVPEGFMSEECQWVMVIHDLAWISADLMGKVGDTFYLPGGGTLSPYKPPRSLQGRLYLGINEKEECLADNDGTVVVKVALFPFTGDEPSSPTLTPADSTATPSDLKEILWERLRNAEVSTNYSQQSEQLVEALFARLADFGQYGGSISQENIRQALQRDDIGIRLNATVQSVWDSWVERGAREGFDPDTTDPGAFADISPFRRLITRLIQGSQGPLSTTEQHALHNLLTRSEDLEAWRDDMNGIIGAINRESFQVTQSPPAATPMPTLQPSVASVQLEFVSIPAGEFTMGSTDADIQAAVAECNATEGNCKEEWFGGEKPAHTVFVSAFQISKYEITNAEYNACVNAGICQKAGRNIADSSIPYKQSYFADNLPVVGVGWQDANIFCIWIGGRLPTEEEWEKAARGTSDQRRYPWGNEFDPSKANLSSGYPTAVGSYPNGISPYGVMDMAGNVFEWTATSVDGRYIIRGGGWSKFAFRGRVTDRGTKLSSGFANYDIGFRCISH